MIHPLTIVTALYALGFEEGWAADDVNGILVWQNQEPQPTEAELIAAGWIKLQPAKEAPEE